MLALFLALTYLSSNALDARLQPRFGASEGAGIVLGLAVEQAGETSVVWLRDGETAQDLRTPLSFDVDSARATVVFGFSVGPEQQAMRWQAPYRPCGRTSSGSAGWVPVLLALAWIRRRGA